LKEKALNFTLWRTRFERGYGIVRQTTGCINEMRVIFLRSAEGPGKGSGDPGRWRGNPGIEMDLPQLSPRLCSSRYLSKVRSSFCVLSRTKMQRSLEQR
jgi:hypothetical protein